MVFVPHRECVPLDAVGYVGTTDTDPEDLESRSLTGCRPWVDEPDPGVPEEDGGLTPGDSETTEDSSRSLVPKTRGPRPSSVGEEGRTGVGEVKLRTKWKEKIK